MSKLINLGEAKILLNLARDAILSKFDKREIKLPTNKKYTSKRGVFITLKKDGELRGCIGYVLPYFTLLDAVVKCARAAAFEDIRFKQVKLNEIDNITLEISILSVPKKLTGTSDEIVSKIKIGKDGLIVKSPFSQGLLLPQVFSEYKCNPIQALEMTCHKAGLSKNDWKLNNVLVESFQAQVFYEISPLGKVIEESF